MGLSSCLFFLFKEDIPTPPHKVDSASVLWLDVVNMAKSKIPKPPPVLTAIEREAIEREVQELAHAFVKEYVEKFKVPMKLGLLNRRYGTAATRRLGERLQTVLQRDPRFYFTLSIQGATNVVVLDAVI